MLHSALRSDRTEQRPEDEEDEEQAGEAHKESRSVTEQPRPSDSENSSCDSLSSDLKLFCTERLGMVN